MSDSAAEKREEGGGGRRRLTTGATLAFAGTVVGLVTGIAGLVFLFRPDLQPTPDEPPAAQSATLSKLTVDPDATRRQYLARIDQPASDYTAQQLAQRGALLEFRIAVNGFEGVPLILKWELFDDDSGEQVNESKAISITPNRGGNEANWEFWVPLPRKPGEFYAVVDLLQPKEHHVLQLDTIRTKPFPGLG